MRNSTVRSVSDPISVWVPFLIMLFMYFVIGVFTVINQQFQIPLKASMLPENSNISNALVTLLNFSWFLAYPFSDLFATRWLENSGYRKTTVYALFILVAGLLVYEAAVWMHTTHPMHITFWGNSISVGFFIFLAGSFVVGTSAAILQVVLNLYLTVVRVGGTTPLQRQMIGGTVNSVGMAIAPLLVSYIIFQRTSLLQVSSSEFTMPVMWMTAIMALIAVVVGYVTMPNLPDSLGKKDTELKEKSIWSFRNFKWGFWGLFIYVGIEVSVGANINMYSIELGGSYISQATHMAALYWGLLLAGRLTGSFLKNISSQLQLVTASIGAIIFLALAIIFANPWILTGVGFFHSIMWPAIFTLAINNLGKYVAKASGLLTMAVIGGGVIPFLQGILADIFGGVWRFTWILVIAGEFYILFYGKSGYKSTEKP